MALKRFSFAECVEEWEGRSWIRVSENRHDNVLLPSVKDEFVKLRLMSWDARRSKYWAELSTVAAALARDKEAVGTGEGALDEDLRVFMIRSELESRDPKMRHRRLMQQQRIARRGHEFFGFLRLPIEVRRLIYDELLVVGDVFVPNSYWRYVSVIQEAIPFVVPLKGSQLYGIHGGLYHRYRNYNDLIEDLGTIVTKEMLPIYTPGLLQGLCRTIQHEANQVFWSQNRFIFPYGTFLYPKGFSFAAHESDPWSYMRLARDLSYTFDMREGERLSESTCNGPALDIRLSRNGLENKTDVSARGSLRRLEGIHEDQLTSVQGIWGYVAGTLKGKTGLRRLQLDFEECFCPLGCCRLVDFVCALFQDGWEIAVPGTIEILGWMHEGEKKQILRDLETLNGVTKRDRIKFVGPSIEDRVLDAAGSPSTVSL